MIVLEARASREGAAIYFVEELLPRLRRLLEDQGEEVEVVAGPASSFAERMRRRLLYTRADVIFHTGNRATVSRARKVVLMRDRLLLPLDEEVPRFPLRYHVRRVLALHGLLAADVISVPTRSMVEPIDRARRRWRLPERPVLVVPHGAPDWEAPDPRPFQDPMRLLLLGIASWQKNIPFMAQVLAANRSAGGPPMHLTVTATGDEVIQEQRLRDAFSAVPDLVSFVGVKERSELRDLYAEHDVFVFPSLVESFGHPPLEAMSMGMPVVVSDRPWAREIAEDCAVYADPRDPGAWVGALRRIHEGGRRENEAGRRRAKAFDWDSAAHDYARMILEERESRSPST